jgi:hypothetical protein
MSKKRKTDHDQTHDRARPQGNLQTAVQSYGWPQKWCAPKHW